jgi:hypothetical protein
MTHGQLVASLLVSGVACTPKATGPKGVGQRLIDGGGQALAVAPHSGAAVYLHAPAHPTGKLLPPDAYLGVLMMLAPDGSIHSLGGEATNLTGSLAFSSDGRELAFLEHFSFENHVGELVLANVNGETIPIAPQTSYFGFQPDGDLIGYVSGPNATLKVGRRQFDAKPGSPPPSDRMVDNQVATFEFVKDADNAPQILYRMKSTAGGGLRRAGLTQPGGMTLAEHVGDYQVAPGGGSVAYTVEAEDGTSELHVSHWSPANQKLGEQVSSFRFSPDGHTVAFVAGIDPQRLLGDIWVADVEKGGAPVRLGKGAGSYRFNADGRLGFIYDYYEPTRAGKFALWDPIRGVLPIADSARVFGFSPSGKYLGYLKRVFKPAYTEQLMLLPLGGAGSNLAEGKLVGEAIYAFDFTPDERDLLYKTECTRGGEACELMSVPTSAPSMPQPVATADGGSTAAVSKNPNARKLVSAVDDYDFSLDGKWLWVTFKNSIGETVDLAVIPAQGESLPRYVDFKVEPGPRWTSAGKIAYVVNNPKRAGLYEADPATAQPLNLGR